MKKFAIFSAVMIIGAGIALAQTLNVPFYRDGDNGVTATRGFIGVVNTTTTDQTITIIYTSLNDSGNPENLTVTSALNANTGVSWRPVSSADVGPLSAAVPNNTIVGPDKTNVSIVGSAKITGVGLQGRYVEQGDTSGSAFGHALISVSP